MPTQDKISRFDESQEKIMAGALVGVCLAFILIILTLDSIDSNLRLALYLFVFALPALALRLVSYAKIEGKWKPPNPFYVQFVGFLGIWATFVGIWFICRHLGLMVAIVLSLSSAICFTLFCIFDFQAKRSLRRFHEESRAPEVSAEESDNYDSEDAETPHGT